MVSMVGQYTVFGSHTSTAITLALDHSLVVYNRNRKGRDRSGLNLHRDPAGLAAG